MPKGLPKLAQAYMAAWNSHDWNKVAAFFTDDCVYEDAAVDRVCHGKQELKAFGDELKVFRADGPIFELKSAFVSGDWMVSEWVMSDTYAGGIPGLEAAVGKKYSIRGASISELHKGKISRNTDYWNMASFLQQLGLMPSAAPKK